jgi:hypothetical protein
MPQYRLLPFWKQPFVRMMVILVPACFVAVGLGKLFGVNYGVFMCAFALIGLLIPPVRRTFNDRW